MRHGSPPTGATSQARTDDLFITNEAQLPSVL